MRAAERRKGARDMPRVCLERPTPVKKVVEDEVLQSCQVSTFQCLFQVGSVSCYWDF